MRRAARKAGDQEKGSDPLPLPKNGSESAARIVARLKLGRCHPDIAERLAAGEFRSARAAAICAGLIVPPTGFDKLMRDWRNGYEAGAERGSWPRSVMTEKPCKDCTRSASRQSAALLLAPRARGVNDKNKRRALHHERAATLALC